MELNNLQKVLFEYVCQNKLFKGLIPISGKATIAYGIYAVLYDLPFIYQIGILQSIRNFIWIFGAFIFVTSILGLIISFAKNDMLPIMALFGLLCISYILTLITAVTSTHMGMRFVLQALFYIIVYAYFAYKAMIRYNQAGGKA